MPISPGETSLTKMRQVPLERDINIAVNGCSGFATSTQKGPLMAKLISHSRDTCFNVSSVFVLSEVQVEVPADPVEEVLHGVHGLPRDVVE